LFFKFIRSPEEFLNINKIKKDDLFLKKNNIYILRSEQFKKTLKHNFSSN